RFVLDENVDPNGNIYASAWQLAGYQIEQLKTLERSNPDQLRRVFEAQNLYNRLGEQLSVAARAAQSRQGDAGISYFYAAAVEKPGHHSIGRQLDDKLERIIGAERDSLRDRIEQSQFFSDQADQFTSYL